YLIDDLGHRFGISPTGQQALAGAGLAGEPLTSLVAPRESIQSRLAFDVPRDSRPLGLVKASRGWFPVRLIIGDAGSWLHRPTVVPISKSMLRSEATKHLPWHRAVVEQKAADSATSPEVLRRFAPQHRL